jgi:hypothetical protein
VKLRIYQMNDTSATRHSVRHHYPSKESLTHEEKIDKRKQLIDTYLRIITNRRTAN